MEYRFNNGVAFNLIVAVIFIGLIDGMVNAVVAFGCGCINFSKDEIILEATNDRDCKDLDLARKTISIRINND